MIKSCSWNTMKCNFCFMPQSHFFFASKAENRSCVSKWKDCHFSTWQKRHMKIDKGRISFWWHYKNPSTISYFFYRLQTYDFIRTSLLKMSHKIKFENDSWTSEIINIDEVRKILGMKWDIFTDFLPLWLEERRRSWVERPPDTRGCSALRWTNGKTFSSHSFRRKRRSFHFYFGGREKAFYSALWRKSKLNSSLKDLTCEFCCVLTLMEFDKYWTKNRRRRRFFWLVVVSSKFRHVTRMLFKTYCQICNLYRILKMIFSTIRVLFWFERSVFLRWGQLIFKKSSFERKVKPSF